MKYWLKTVAGILVFTAGSVSWAEAEDFENSNNDAQVQMRSQAWQMQSMSSQERSLYRELNEPTSQGKGNAGGKKKRYGQGNSNGSGSMHRYGQGNDQAYGSGYGSRQGGGSGNGGGGRGR